MGLKIPYLLDLSLMFPGGNLSVQASAVGAHTAGKFVFRIKLRPSWHGQNIKRLHTRVSRLGYIQKTNLSSWNLLSSENFYFTTRIDVFSRNRLKFGVTEFNCLLFSVNF